MFQTYLISISVCHILTSLFALPCLASPTKHAAPKPNFVFILTDDQDLLLNSLDYMPFVQKHITEQGTFFKKHYCTAAVCCPARVTLWTGKYPHNTNVTNVMPPYGGYPKFVEQGLNENYLPIWLQAAGYNTYYSGKLFNYLNETNYNSPFPAGFTSNEYLLDPTTYLYWNSTFQRDRDSPRELLGSYSTDVIAEATNSFIDHSIAADAPFFVVAAPIAPHSTHVGEGIANATAAIPATRHNDLFTDQEVPRNEGFNPELPSGASWIRGLPRLNDAEIERGDEWHRQRLRSLQAVDELVDGVIQKLEETGTLDNTYIIYTSDNGFHIGQHRLQAGKGCPYEEDVNVPFIIRGPDVAKNVTSELVTSHTDLAPTIMALAGEEPRPDFDGLAIPVKQFQTPVSAKWQEHVGIEYWGPNAIGEGVVGAVPIFENTYKAIRVFSQTYNLYYSVWCNGDRELYDMTTDQYQLTNLLLVEQPPIILGRPLDQVSSRLDALLMVQKSCKGVACQRPWSQIHISGDVNNISDALQPQFDAFYSEQVKVEFDRCEQGYILDAEGPQFDAKAWQYMEDWV